MFTFISSSLEYIIPFLIVLTVLVFFHELGHYLVARWNGVKVEVFSIGFGPEIFGWTDKAQTRWKFSLIPLGGYVRMFGDADASGQSVNPELKTMTAEQKSLTLHSKSPLQRIAVSAAGPLANYLLAIVLLTGIFIYEGIPTLTNEIGEVVPGSVAETIGLKKGDRITHLNSTTIADFDNIVEAVKGQSGQDIKVEISRIPSTGQEIGKDAPKDAPRETLVLTGRMVTKDKTSGEEKPAAQLGIRPGGKEYKAINPIRSVGEAVSMCYTYSKNTLYMLGQMIMGQKGSGELGGIISIGSFAKESATGGPISLLFFMALLSINLGLINLLPVPVLDGGHILFCSIEAIIRRPVSEKIQEVAFGIGLFIVVGLMIYTTWSDLSRFKVFDKVMGLFS